MLMMILDNSSYRPNLKVGKKKNKHLEAENGLKLSHITKFAYFKSYFTFRIYISGRARSSFSDFEMLFLTVMIDLVRLA